MQFIKFSQTVEKAADAGVNFIDTADVRPLPRRAVGSTLLLKDLEAEVAVIFDADS
jgi:hypothetical protein